MKTLLIFLLAASAVSAATHEIRVFGTCMVPVIADGQRVQVDAGFRFDQLKVGDIVTFLIGDQKRAHRIVEIRRAANGEKFLITKGDNVASREIVTAKEYLGRVSV